MEKGRMVEGFHDWAVSRNKTPQGKRDVGHQPPPYQRHHPINATTTTLPGNDQSEHATVFCIINTSNTPL
jgi:hypothetical protein